MFNNGRKKKFDFIYNDFSDNLVYGVTKSNESVILEDGGIGTFGNKIHESNIHFKMDPVGLNNRVVEICDIITHL